MRATIVTHAAVTLVAGALAGCSLGRYTPGQAGFTRERSGGGINSYGKQTNVYGIDPNTGSPYLIESRQEGPVVSTTAISTSQTTEDARDWGWAARFPVSYLVPALRYPGLGFRTGGGAGFVADAALILPGDRIGFALGVFVDDLSVDFGARTFSAYVYGGRGQFMVAIIPRIEWHIGIGVAAANFGLSATGDSHSSTMATYGDAVLAATGESGFLFNVVRTPKVFVSLGVGVRGYLSQSANVSGKSVSLEGGALTFDFTLGI